MTDARRGSPIIKIALVVVATLAASLAPAARSAATPHMKGAARDPELLRRQVVRLFDRLDRASRVIETVREELATVEDRIAELSRRIEAQQRLLNRRAAEAYMAGRASGVESLLGASSFTEVEDALEFLEAVSEEDRDLLLSLRDRRAELELEQGRLHALGVELRRKRQWLEATATDLVEQLRQQQAIFAREVEAPEQDGSTGGTSDPSPAPSPTIDPSPPVGAETVRELIRDRFGPLGDRTTRVALCVAEAESGFDPRAVNPATGAAGVFQFLPSTWETVSELAGWPGASVFDARANVAVAAWAVAQYGWHPWRSVAAGCGA